MSDDPPFTTILAALDNLRRDLASARSDIMARIDRLQDRLVAEQEGSIVNLAAAERAERIARGTRDDLRKEIAGLVTELGGLVEQIGALTRQNRALQSRVNALEDRQTPQGP